MSTGKYDPPPEREGTHSYTVGKSGRVVEITRLEKNLLYVHYRDQPGVTKLILQKENLFHLTGSGEPISRLNWDDILDTL
ncbi:MAG: hypothetical protein JWP05_900 [Microbacteriaceae bacterium]|nr:hypothetical protein [Microbacteriaceae bacterium]